MNKITVLVFAADPHSAPPHGTQPRLLLDEDVRQMRMKVEEAEFRERVEFDVRGAARTDDLLLALNKKRPEVVHFSGHGDSEGLVLVGKNGEPHPVTTAALEKLFKVLGGNVRVVVLNACFSLPHAKAIARLVGCAIGTPKGIPDEAAITFGASFYRAIAFGESVQAAYDQACTALLLDGWDEAAYPQLEVGDGVDPTRVILVPRDPPPAAIPLLHAPHRIDPEADARLIRSNDAQLIVRHPFEVLTDGRGDHVPQSLVGLPAPRPRRSGWVFPAFVWMASLGIALTRVENLGWALALSFFLLFLTAALLYFAHTGRARWLTRGRAVGAAILLSAVAVYFGANVLNGELAAAKRLYRVQNYEAALPIFQELADQGDPEAMGFLGIMYLAGQGFGEQDSVGIRWLTRAAEERDPRAMYALGIAYAKARE